MLTLQNAYNSFSRLKRDVSDVPQATFIEWCQFVARFIYDKGKKVDASRFVKSQSYSVVLPPQTESLPSDFQDLNQTVCGLYPYNTRKREVVTFDSTGDSGVTFSDSGGTSAYNTNIKVQGGSSRGYTGDAAATLLLSFATNINWEDFDDQEADSPTNDYVSIWVYVGNSVPTSATIEFSTLNTGADVGVNQFSYAYSSLVEGWNHIKVLKSAFTTTGTPDWGGVGYLRLIYTGGGADTNVYWDKLELVENNVNGKDESKEKIGVTGYGSKSEGYYIEGSNIIFTNADTIVDNDYVMKYIPVPPTLTALTDYFTVDGTANTAQIVENRHLEYLVKAIDVLYSQWDDDAGAESIADFRFTRALGDLLDSFTRTPQISQMQNYTNNF